MLAAALGFRSSSIDQLTLRSTTFIRGTCSHRLARMYMDPRVSNVDKIQAFVLREIRVRAQCREDVVALLDPTEGGFYARIGRLIKHDRRKNKANCHPLLNLGAQRPPRRYQDAYIARGSQTILPFKVAYEPAGG